MSGLLGRLIPALEDRYAAERRLGSGGIIPYDQWNHPDYLPRNRDVRPSLVQKCRAFFVLAAAVLSAGCGVPGDAGPALGGDMLVHLEDHLDTAAPFAPDLPSRLRSGAARESPACYTGVRPWEDPDALVPINEERPDLETKYREFLEAQWTAHRALAQHVGTAGQAAALTPEQLETLRALGYIR